MTRGPAQLGRCGEARNLSSVTPRVHTGGGGRGGCKLPDYFEKGAEGRVMAGTCRYAPQYMRDHALLAVPHLESIAI